MDRARVLIAIAIGLAATIGHVVAGACRDGVGLAVIPTVVVIMLMAALVVAGIVVAEWGPQSSSTSHFTADAFRFLTFTQGAEHPER